jgi:hypothetical protein
MRPIKLTVKGLNSFIEEQSVDLFLVLFVACAHDLMLYIELPLENMTH